MTKKLIQRYSKDDINIIMYNLCEYLPAPTAVVVAATAEGVAILASASVFSFSSLAAFN